MSKKLKLIKLSTIYINIQMIRANTGFYCWLALHTGVLGIWYRTEVKSYFLMNRSLSPAVRPKSSHRHSPSKSPTRITRSPSFHNGSGPPAVKSSQQNQSSLRSPIGSPARKAPEPSASNLDRGLSKSHSPNDSPKRIRKGRGFTEQYSYARRYRTPSPEHSPRGYRYGGRNVPERKRDRYDWK